MIERVQRSSSPAHSSNTKRIGLLPLGAAICLQPAIPCSFS